MEWWWWWWVMSRGVQVPLKFRDPHTDPVANDLKGYHYGESTQIVAEYPDAAFQYDILLRSDLDAFLTPGRCSLCLFVCLFV
jgi:hypothetical protein